MKNSLTIAGFFVAAGLAGCGGGKGENPGRVYMPDMGYSRAYETYGYNNVEGEYDTLQKRRINYTALPVAGTMARGDMPAYPYPGNDSGYAMAVNFRNPDTAALTKEKKAEAERLYLIHCAICHGTQLDGNGPLWKNGDGPYPAAPRNLKDDYSKKLADGQIYHVIEFGKGQMGSYAAQVKPEQRWWIIQYIREKQGGGTAGSKTDTTAKAAQGATSGGAAATDTTGMNK